jgi:hypothetical protein
MPLVINTPQKAKNTITEFLNLKTSNERYDFIEEYGFETLKNAVEALSENDSGYSLSRKERKNLIKAVDETVGMKFSKSNIESRTDNKKTQIINVLNELDPKLGRDNEPLYNRLFAYNKDNLIPEIVTGKFEEKAQIRLRHMAKNYDQMLQEGELTPEQISTFENYILSPLNAGMLKKEIQNMGVLGKFKNNFSKSSKEYQKINSILDDIQTTKLSMSQGSMSNLRDGVNSDFEAARSARSRAKTEQSRTQSGPTQPEGRI